jgi:zinc D-Ala-D-Ala carboxypeptidase
MQKRMLAGLSSAAAAVAVAIPIAVAAPASAATPSETFGQYQQACFNEGGTRPSDPASDDYIIPAEQLVEGDDDACVAYLQELLDSKGWGFNGGFPYSLAIDGRFGPLTESAVKSFQTGMGLKPDGEVGPLTWTALGSFRD